jgi:nucleoside-diphosphate-sugar epimerase
MFSSHPLYQEDIARIARAIDGEQLRGASVLVTGAAGLIGTMLVDALMYRGGIAVYAAGRSTAKARARLGDYFGNNLFHFVQGDLHLPITLDANIDYIIHGASNTHPVAYAADPVNTVMLSVLGTKNILDFAVQKSVKRTLFLSTVEVYGENRDGTERFTEDYCGCIDCNTLRAGYPEGKRAAEALCQAYITQHDIDVVIPRCSRVYGPTDGEDDSKAVAQFLRGAAKGEDVVLKSAGTQRYSYCYAADVCSALLFLLFHGEKGAAYNVAGPDVISLREIAELLAAYSGKKVRYAPPGETEAKGFSKASTAILDCAKINALGWRAEVSLKEGLLRTLEIMRGTNGG